MQSVQKNTENSAVASNCCNRDKINEIVICLQNIIVINYIIVIHFRMKMLRFKKRITSRFVEDSDSFIRLNPIVENCVYFHVQII